MNLLSHDREYLRESNVQPDHFFFHDQKRDMTSSVTRSKRFKCFSSFLKYLFVINWQVFSVFLNNSFYTVLSLSNYYSIFKAEANEN